MTTYQILAITATYITLLIGVIAAIWSHRAAVNKRLEHGSVRMAVQDEKIKMLKDEVEKKADNQLVTEQFRNVNNKLDEIKTMLENRK